MPGFLILIISLIFMGGFLIGRKGIILILIWVLIEGVVRKWLLPGSHIFIFFISHMILGGIYLRFFGAKIIGKLKILPKHPTNKFLILLFFWGVLEAFNPNLPNRLVGLLGLTIYFYYVPFSFIVEQVFNKKEKIFRFFKFYSVLSFPLFLLGIVQFFTPIGSVLNIYLAEEKRVVTVATIGEHVRITSTFPFITGYTTYLIFIIFIFIYLLSTRKLSKRMASFIYLNLSLAVVNLLMTGSRGSIGLIIILVILYLFLSGITSFRLMKRTFFVLILSLIFTVTILSFTYFGRQAFSTFLERLKGTEDIIPRIVATFIPFKSIKDAGVYGYGIGSEYQGSDRLVKESDWGEIPRGSEVEPERVLLELGLIGYILVYLLRFLYLRHFWSLSKKLKDRDLKLLSLVLLLFQLQYFHFGNLVFELTASIFYWFSVGFLFLLPKLDQYKVQ